MAEHVVGVHHQRARLRLRVARCLGDDGRQIREPAVHVEQAERVRAPVRRDVADDAARDVAAPGPLREVGAVRLPARAGRLGGSRAAAAARARAGAPGSGRAAGAGGAGGPGRSTPAGGPGRSARAAAGDPGAGGPVVPPLPAPLPATPPPPVPVPAAPVVPAPPLPVLPPAPAAAPAVPVGVPPEPSPPVPVPVGPLPSLVAHEAAASRTTAAATRLGEDGVRESRPMPDQ